MRALIAAVAVLALSACSGDDTTSATTAPTTQAPASASDTTTPAITVAESADVSALGVVLAAVLLAEGDVEQAVSDGLVTVAEVDAAVAAIRDDTMDQWVALAAD